MIEHVLAVGERNLGYANALIADVPEERMCEQPAGYPNHPAWQIGHIALTSDFVGAMLGLEPALPAQWKDLFMTGSVPTAAASLYPTKSELLQALADQHARFSKALRTADASTLAQPLPDENLRRIFPTIGAIATSALTSHEAIHLGQLSVWRRLAGLPPALRF